MKWLYDPSRDKYLSRVDDEIRLTERGWFGGGLGVGITMALILTSLGIGLGALLILLWRAFTG